MADEHESDSDDADASTKSISMQQMAKARRAIDISPLLTFPPFPEIVVAVIPLL